MRTDIPHKFKAKRNEDFAIDNLKIGCYYVPKMGTILLATKELAITVKILGRKILNRLKQEHSDVCSQADAWEAEAAAACWCRPLDMKRRYPTGSILPDNEVIFNLKGNKYRLKVKINYKNQLILIKNAGTHDEYMSW